MTALPTPSTDGLILAAAEGCLRRYGFAGLSMRRVAEEAGVPLSQIHYHFGSKKKLVLAVLAAQNARLLERQAAMLSEPCPLAERWERACDYLDQDLDSGYVRVLQEMLAAGWSDPELALEVRRLLGGWKDLITQTLREAEARLGGYGPFAADEVAALSSMLFMGAEVLILGGFEQEGRPIRPALRKVGLLIAAAEKARN